MSEVTTAFEIIRTVTKTMLESPEVQRALDAVVRSISERMGVEVCSIYLFDSETQKLRLASSQGLNQEGIAGVTLSPNEGLTGAVFSRGEVINLANPNADSRFKYFPSLGEERMNNFMGISIPPGRPYGNGVLILQSRLSTPFNSTLEDLAFTLAAQVGALLDSRNAPPTGTQTSLQISLSGEPPPFLRAHVAFGGIADGPVHVLQTQAVWDDILFSECEDPDAELKVLEEAMELARGEARWLRTRAGEIFAEMDARIFDAHELFLQDPHFIGVIQSHIRENKSAAFAVKLAAREMARTFQESGNTKLAERAADVKDVGLRLISALREARDHYHPEHESETGVILAAVELLPSDLVYMQSRKLLGILCETGGTTSHAAILARSLDIPCFIGIPELTSFIHPGTRVIMDGNSGLLYIQPDEHVIREYKRLAETRHHTRTVLMDEDRTQDGHRVHLSGNVSLLSDLGLMKRFGIQSIGLYRSEFFFMIRNSFPDENTQYDVYRQVMERCGLFSVTFRLLDVGGDKPLRYFNWGKEENPSLGWRSIRMLLKRPDILKPHLRALLRAAQLGEMRLLIPMISTLTELREVKRLIRASAAELELETGIVIRIPPIGIMIEIPSTIFQINGFMLECDFVCLGTNDLLQYLFAVDRGNERVASYHQPYHPALWEALRRVAEAAVIAGKSVTVCGEMAADPKAMALLLGLGFNAFSISPGTAPGLRQALVRYNLKDCQNLVQKVLELSTAEEVKEAVEAFVDRLN